MPHQAKIQSCSTGNHNGDCDNANTCNLDCGSILLRSRYTIELMKTAAALRYSVSTAYMCTCALFHIYFRQFAAKVDLRLDLMSDVVDTSSVMQLNPENISKIVEVFCYSVHWLKHA